MKFIYLNFTNMYEDIWHFKRGRATTQRSRKVRLRGTAESQRGSGEWEDPLQPGGQLAITISFYTRKKQMGNIPRRSLLRARRALCWSASQHWINLCSPCLVAEARLREWHPERRPSRPAEAQRGRSHSLLCPILLRKGIICDWMPAMNAAWNKVR